MKHDSAGANSSGAGAGPAAAAVARHRPPVQTPSPSRRLATYAELQQDEVYHYLADNPAIHTAYRHRLNCWEAFLTLFQFHNETVNVWSHLSGALLFIGLLMRLAVWGVATASHTVSLDDGSAGAVSPGDGVVPVWPIAIFLVSAVTCLGASATFHLLHVVDQGWYRTLSSADYASIAILICGSTIPPIAFGFWCSPGVAALYTVACTAIAGASMALGMMPAFRTPPWRTTRMASFIATGAFGLVPLLHLLSSTQTQYAEAAEGMATMAALYVCGALLYGFRVPERFFPGRFDWGGTSHNVSWRRALRIARCTPQVEPITIACGVL